LIPLSDKAEFFDGELRREYKKRKTTSQLGQKSLHESCIILWQPEVERIAKTKAG
jgi:hypothetical protein